MQFFFKQIGLPRPHQSNESPNRNRSPLCFKGFVWIRVKKKYGFKNFAMPYWRYLIPVTGSLRWFDGVFQGRYITILSTNYAAVLDKDTNLLWSELQWHRSCHSDEMSPLLPILLADVFLGTPSQELFSPIATSKLERFRFLRALSKGWSFYG